MAEKSSKHTKKQEFELMNMLWSEECMLYPEAFVRAVFPWGEPGPLQNFKGPREWQVEELRKIGLHNHQNQVRINEGEMPIPYYLAIASGRGPGKSSLVAWLALWSMSTRVGSATVITANTEQQLMSRTWPELGKWHTLMINSHWFERTATTLRPSKLLDLSGTGIDTAYYYAQAQLWSEENPDAFAGLHNANGMVLIMDEASGIPQSIWDVSEGFFTEPIFLRLWIVFSNPRRPSGAFFDCFHTMSKFWNTRHIDSRDVEGLDQTVFQKIVDKHGEDDDVTRVEVKGQFPRTGSNQLIGWDTVNDACKGNIKREDVAGSAKVLSVDIARFGCFDDQTEILTDSGWKYFYELNGAEKVLSLDIETGEAEWGDIQQIHKYEFNGTLNLYETERINFCVTDNHNFLVRSNVKSDKYVLRRYDKLPRDYVVRGWHNWTGSNEEYIWFKTEVTMPYGGTRSHTNKFTFMQWAEFMGWYLSEGNVYTELRKHGRYRIIITQNPGDKMDSIKMLLADMGISWRLCSNGMQVEFTSKSIGMHLLRECNHGAANKKIPEYIKNASCKAIRVFLDSFLLGDGSCRADGKGRCYSTSSIQMANDIHEMLVKLGRAGKMRMAQRKGSVFYIGDRKVVRRNNTYIVYESSRKDRWIGKNHKAKKHKYSGYVWCVSTPHKTIHVRRKGCTMWSGNSDLSVINKRQGLLCEVPIDFAKMDNMQMAGIIANIAVAWNPDVIIIGSGGGQGVIDRLKQLGFNVIEVDEGGSADRKDLYLNKRIEMWDKAAEWFLAGGVIPDHQRLKEDLSSPIYSYTDNTNKKVLESADAMKKRGLPSLDFGTAFVLGFAFDVAPTMGMNNKANKGKVNHDWDPFEIELPKKGNDQMVADYMRNFGE